MRLATTLEENNAVNHFKKIAKENRDNQAVLIFEFYKGL